MTQPTYLSLFTGAGGIDLGLDHAGWTCTGQAEIDDTCRAVLARHWTNTRRWRDVRDVPYADGHGRRRPVDGNDDHTGTHRPTRDPRHPWWHADLIAGGFPCQDISVAGRRAGLAGERSGLWWEFHRVIDVVRPRAVLVENVEGLLSSNGGRDMGAILDALVDLGYGAAWRVLDAQHFGVPQRRRRVFLLALLGGDSGTRRAAQVLALTPGGGGDPAPRTSTRPGTAGDIGGSVADTLRSHPWPGSNSNGGIVVGGGHGLNAEKAGGGQLIPTSRRPVGPLTTRTGALRGDNLDGEHYVATVSTLQAPKGRGWRVDAEGAAGGHKLPTSVHLTQDPITGVGVAPSLGATSGGMGVHTTGVRRLTPRECERLMGWPDDHTRWTADGREVSDSRRYAMCGNGVVAPVAEWIGLRLRGQLFADDVYAEINHEGVAA